MKGNTVTIAQTVELYVETCFQCGVTFGMPTDFQGYRMRDKTDFYCPNGHRQQYIGKSDAELRKDAERRAAAAEEDARIAHAARLQAEREHRAEIAWLAKRCEGGVCPCCNRSFVQLARHMKSKHPDHAT